MAENFRISILPNRRVAVTRGVVEAAVRRDSRRASLSRGVIVAVVVGVVVVVLIVLKIDVVKHNAENSSANTEDRLFDAASTSRVGNGGVARR